MRLLCVLLAVGGPAGCGPAPDYLAEAAVAAATAAAENPEQTPDEEPDAGPDDTPDDVPDDGPTVCPSCAGLGWLGDGRVKKDCPDCDTPWRGRPQPHEPPAGAAGSGEEAEPPEPPVFTTDLDAARRAARGGDKPLMIFFEQPGCPPCLAAKSRLFCDREVREWWRKYFVCVLIDTQRQPSVARRYRVRTTPTIMVTAPGGAVYVRTGIGASSRKELTDWCRRCRDELLKSD